MHIFKRIICFALLIHSVATYGQKQEQEFSISEDEFPKAAIDYLQFLELDFKKVKWYKELQNELVSFEAKINHEGHLYSIEFDSLGRLEDIEKLVSFKKLPTETNRILNKSLTNKLGKYKIVKTQIQYSSTDKMVKNLNDLSAKNSEVRYEIELFYRKDKSKKLVEYLLSGNGEIISFREVMIRSTENLTY